MRRIFDGGERAIDVLAIVENLMPHAAMRTMAAVKCASPRRIRRMRSGSGGLFTGSGFLLLALAMWTMQPSGMRDY